MRFARATALVVAATLASAAGAATSTAVADVRATNDCLTVAGDPMADPLAPLPSCQGGGYMSSYTISHPESPYTDAVIDECSIARGRQNETSVEVDPRNSDVLIGSSNDYCGVFTHGLGATGPVWLGYYRSENGGESWVDSLVPGYPEDSSPYKALAHVRTAGSGDPVIAWDRDGRVFLGSESSGDPAGSAKGFGDVWVGRYVNPGGPSGDTADDGKAFAGSEVVGKGSSSPGSGKFNDKTAIEVDRTGGRCDGAVYFAWSRFNGGGSNGYNSSVQFVRSGDHGASWTSPLVLTNTVHDIQSPDIAVTRRGDIYVAFRQFASVRSSDDRDAVQYVKSTDCGRTWSKPRLVANFVPYDATDVPDEQPVPAALGPADGDDLEDEGAGKGGVDAPAGDCGDFSAHCESGFTFFRHTTQVRATADQTPAGAGSDSVYIVFDPTIPGTEIASGSSYGSVVSGDLPLKYHRRVGSQEGVYLTILNGATGNAGTPELIDEQARGHQLFPDISVTDGVMHAIWYDTRNDECYSRRRPIGNCEDRSTVPALDVYGASAPVGGNWTVSRISDETTNPNYEQFGGRTVPFAGDYLWVTSTGSFAYTLWTDYRDVVGGTDQREGTGDEDGSSADVHQCRTAANGAWTADQCPHAGGLDQNAYGDLAP